MSVNRFMQLLACIAIVLGLAQSIGGCGGDTEEQPIPPEPSQCGSQVMPEQTPGAACATDADCGARACWAGVCDMGACRYENAPATLLCSECNASGVCDGNGVCASN